jgi:hypothetical protein
LPNVLGCVWANRLARGWYSSAFHFLCCISPLAENGVEGWCLGLPWEVSANYIRSGHRNPDDFEPNSLRTVVLSEAEGIKAVVGKPKGGKDAATEVVSFLFDVSKAGWRERAFLRRFALQGA